MIITSFSNPKVKFIRKLDQKKYRQETGLCFIEGLRIVGEAVQTGVVIESLVIAPDLLVSDFGQSLLDHPGTEQIERIEVSTEIFEKIAHKEGPQGIGAVIHQNWQPLTSLFVNPDDLWIALDAIADPGNLGTIMRTAEAVGCRGIVLLGQTTDPFDPAAIKASMGAVFSLDLAQTEWETFQTWQQKSKLTLIGTSDSAACDYQSIKYPHPLVLLMGCERHGLSPEMINACAHNVSIPMKGRTDSLNLAVATAVVLYEIYNQTRDLDIIKS